MTLLYVIVNCTDYTHISAINVFDDNFIEYMANASHELRSRQGGRTKPYKCRPDWNDHARDLHTAL